MKNTKIKNHFAKKISLHTSFEQKQQKNQSNQTDQQTVSKLKLTLQWNKSDSNGNAVKER